MMTANGAWRRVTKSSTCPVCGKSDWCAWSPDQTTLRCMRAAGAAPPNGMSKLGDDRKGGTLFCKSDDPRTRKRTGGWKKYARGSGGSNKNGKKGPQPAPVPAPMPASESIEWSAEAQRCATAMPREQRKSLAASLGVTAKSLISIGIGWACGADLKKWKAGGAGWSGPAYPPAAFTFPEQSGSGEVVGISLRAEDGRKGSPSGKVGARRGLIVPSTLRVRPDPVLIVEGASDVAALETLGIAAVGRPSCSGGVGDLAQALQGRECIVIGENDKKANGNWPGRDGARSVARGLGGEWGGTVPFALPPDGVKDVRAWLKKLIAEGLDLSNRKEVSAAAKNMVAEVRKRLQRDEQNGDDEESRGHPYKFTPRGIVIERPTDGGKVEAPLTNFTARIIADVSRDDGAENRRVFTIEGRVGDGPERVFDIPAERFATMNWPVEHMGVSAIVMPGMGAKDHARTAIQHFSSGAVIRTVYLHLGWIRLGDENVYLHAGGAIGRNGAVEGVEVDAPSDLSNYILPPPPTGEALTTAMREVLKLVNLGPHRVTVPLLGGMFRAAIESCQFSMHIEGFTGSFKSSAAGVFLAHFGAAFDDKHLPASWTSTENALEGLSFSAKDVPLVVDDFIPSGTSNDQQRMYAKAERLMRGAGNQQGRARMRADTSFRPAKYPRGLIVSTGEEIPTGQSLRARLFILSVSKGDIKQDRLTAAQAQAAAGIYCSAMAGFVQWLAHDLAAVRKRLRDRVLSLRNATTGNHPHRQTAVIAAELQAGFEIMITFAVESRAIDAKQAQVLLAAADSAFEEAALAQAAHQRDADPVARFLSLLASAIASGAAHVASAAPVISEPGDDVPSDAGAWGWRPQNVGGANGRTEWRASGERVGYVDGENLYLDRDAAFKAANKVAGDFPITLSQTTLAKRLWERGLLKRREDRDHLTVQVSLHGQRRRVLHFAADALIQPGKPGNPEGDPDNEAGTADSVPGLCPGSPDDASATGSENRGTTLNADDSQGRSAADAPNSPVAPVSTSREPSTATRPGPPKTCYGCGHVRWFTTVGNGRKDWACGACHPPISPPRDIIWWEGNDNRCQQSPLTSPHVGTRVVRTGETG